MTSDEQKKVFANNLTNLLNINGKSQKEVADYLGIGLSTFNSWCTATKLPRMDKVQILADYFKVGKSALLDKKSDSIDYVFTMDTDTRETAQFIFENDKLLFDVYNSDKRDQLMSYAKFLMDRENKENGD